MQEEQIIAGLKAKDRMTTEYAYEKYSKPLYAIICKYISDQEIADDVFCSSFLKIIRGIENYDISKGPLYNWMVGICLISAIDMKRSKEINSPEPYRPMSSENNNPLSMDHLGKIGDKPSFGPFEK